MVAAGFSERTIQRAANDIGVENERRGFPSVTWWRLPVAPGTGAEVGATVNSAQPRPWKDVGSPVAPTHVDGVTGERAQPLIGDNDYLPWLFGKLEHGLISEGEWHQADRAHRLVVQRRTA